MAQLTSEAIVANGTSHVGLRLGRLVLPSILLLGLGLRLWDIRRPFIGDLAWNEVYYAYIARSFFNGQWLAQYDIHAGAPVYSSPLVPWLMYASFRILGVTEGAARLPMLAAAMASLIIFYGLVRALYTARVAVVATFMAAILPGIVFYSRAVQLDGAMTMFGLGAIMAVVLYRRGGSRLWLAVALLAFALAILTKYSAVFFWPALAWAWLSYARPAEQRRRWLSLLGFTALALAPALAWVILQLMVIRPAPAPAYPIDPATPESGLSAAQYFVRFSEWSPGRFKAALMATWVNLEQQVGPAVWYPFLLVGLCLALNLAAKRYRADYVFPLLLVMPWFLQILYPRAWLDNAYYTYPALYGLCILAALLTVRVFQHLKESDYPDRRLQGLGFLFGVLVLVASVMSYNQVYHKSYYPWPLIEQPGPDYSARQVAALNVDHQPVLTDLPFALYYTGADTSYGRYAWWFGNPEGLTKAIRDHRFEYIVLTYQPPIEVVDALAASQYTPVAPAAWRRNRLP